MKLIAQVVKRVNETIGEHEFEACKASCKAGTALNEKGDERHEARACCIGERHDESEG
jgi:hypothetical protein